MNETMDPSSSPFHVCMHELDALYREVETPWRLCLTNRLEALLRAMRAEMTPLHQAAPAWITKGISDGPGTGEGNG